MGGNTEVVLHDLTGLNNSIIAIEMDKSAKIYCIKYTP